MLDLNNIQESSDNCLSDTVFWKFLNVLLKDQNETETLNDFLVIDLTDYTFKIPKNNCNQQQVIIPIRIISFVDCKLNYNYHTIGHTNVAIYNSKINTLELFEPHGTRYSGYNPLNLDINGMIHYLICKMFNKKEMIFKSIGGMQYKQNLEFPTAGHCTAWSLLFIHYKFLFLDITELCQWSSKQLDVYIRKYITNVIGNQNSSSMWIKDDNIVIEKIQINNTNVMKHINYLFDVFYNQIKLYIKTDIHSEFIELNKCKDKLFIELNSFVLHFPLLFQSVCLNYKHPYNYSCNDFIN